MKLIIVCMSFVKQVNGKLIIILVWVDDLIIAGSSDSLVSDTKRMLEDRFHKKDLGKLSYFLGMSFEQGPDYVKMNQRVYLTRVIERFGMSSCKPRSTPSEQKLESDGEDFVENGKYCELVGIV